jgi:hypothetical protein
MRMYAYFAVAMVVMTASSAWSQSMSTSAGKLIVEAPTLTAIGVEWKIAGDDNTNASVEVTYRRKGDKAWRKALPLLRLHHELINALAPPFEASEPSGDNARGTRENPWHYDVGNMFAGSVLSLQPGTDYECHFVLRDPDGVKGENEKTITVTTRKVPTAAAGGRVLHVYPIGWTGPKQQPAFTGLMRAYNLGASASDHEVAFPPRVHPGDTILVHAGLYVSDRFHYLAGMPHPGWLGLAAPTDGTYYLTQSGTPDKPIMIKAAGDGEVIFDGAGNGNLFNVLRANYNYFEGITVRNTTVAFLAGWKNITGANGFTLTHSRVYNVGRVVQGEWSQSRDYYIADNFFVGRHVPDKILGWSRGPWVNFPGYPESIESEYAVKVYGQGHVVANNYIANWHDGVDISTYGEPDGTPEIDSSQITGPTPMDDRIAASIDFYGNDFYNIGDNCVEVDGGVLNLRVFANRCFNVAQQAFSAQPVLGGPAYFYGNIVYNDPGEGPLKFSETPAGVLIYQNTFVGGDTAPSAPVANVHLRNNLFLGRGRDLPVYIIRTTTNYSTSDYNGFSSNPTDMQFEWTSPADGAAADFDYTHKLTVRRFKTLGDFQAATGQDKHSVALDYSIFEKVPLPDDSDPQRLYNPENMDFRLKPGSAAIGAGIALPTINDEFTGNAPDLGAYQSGRPVPVYGPRSWPQGATAQDMAGFRSWAGPAQVGGPLNPR